MMSETSLLFSPKVSERHLYRIRKYVQLYSMDFYCHDQTQCIKYHAYKRTCGGDISTITSTPTQMHRRQQPHTHTHTHASILLLLIMSLACTHIDAEERTGALLIVSDFLKVSIQARKGTERDEQ